MHFRLNFIIDTVCVTWNHLSAFRIGTQLLAQVSSCILRSRGLLGIPEDLPAVGALTAGCAKSLPSTSAIDSVVDAGVDAEVQAAMNLPGSNAVGVPGLGFIGCLSG